MNIYIIMKCAPNDNGYGATVNVVQATESQTGAEIALHDLQTSGDGAAYWIESTFLKKG